MEHPDDQSLGDTLFLPKEVVGVSVPFNSIQNVVGSAEIPE